jgi:hypothetical protein
MSEWPVLLHCGDESLAAPVGIRLLLQLESFSGFWMLHCPSDGVWVGVHFVGVVRAVFGML